MDEWLCLCVSVRICIGRNTEKRLRDRKRKRERGKRATNASEKELPKCNRILLDIYIHVLFFLFSSRSLLRCLFIRYWCWSHAKLAQRIIYGILCLTFHTTCSLNSVIWMLYMLSVYTWKQKKMCDIGWCECDLIYAIE